VYLEGTGTVTVATGAACAGITCISFTGTFTGSGGLTISVNSSAALTFVAGMTFSYTGNITIYGAASVSGSPLVSFTGAGFSFPALSFTSNSHGIRFKVLDSGNTFAAISAPSNASLSVNFAGTTTVGSLNFPASASYPGSLSCGSWLPSVAPVAQSDSCTIGGTVTSPGGYTYSITINGITKTKVTAPSSTAISIANNLTSQINNDPVLGAFVTVVRSGNSLLITAATPGIPFTVSSTTTDDPTGTFTHATPTASDVGSGGTAGSIVYSGGGIVACDYLSIVNSSASPGATFYAGSHSTDVGNNTGWTFGNPPTASRNLFFGSNF
jgi:hypothetical protein